MPLNKPTRSLLLSLGCQVVGAAAALAIARSFDASVIAAVVAGITAGVVARLVNLSSAWLIFNALTPLTVSLLLTLSSNGLATVIITSVTVLMVLLYLPTLVSGVPYYITHQHVFESVREQLPLDRAFTFIDLGCGNAELLVFLAQRFPSGTFIGVELSPVALAIGRWRAKRAHVRNVTLLCANLWSFPISNADYIYAFLAPPVMARLDVKLRKELKLGAAAIVNAFPLPRTSAQEIAFDGDERSHLYIYR